MSRNLDELFIYPQQWLDEECASVVQLVRQWADREIVTKRMEYREGYDRLFHEKRKKLCIDIGLQKLTVPADLGGFGWNSPSKAPALLGLASEIGRADASTGVLAVSAWTLFSLAAARAGESGTLLSTLATGFSGDDLRTPAFIIPGPGTVGVTTPLFLGRSIAPEAKARKGDYTISGKNLRPFIAGAAADVFCVVCAGKNGKPCIAFVPGDAPGVERGSPFLTTGLNACGNADISLSDTKVPGENILENDHVVHELFVWLNLLLGGVSVGAAANFFELLADWSDNRVIKGGTTLKENPLCASVLADVAEEIALSRLLLHDLAWIIATPSAMEAPAITRTFTFAEMIGARAQQGVLRAMNRGLELMGSAGYSKEWHVEKHWRDVKTIQSLLCGVGAEAPVKMDTARFFYNCTEI